MRKGADIQYGKDRVHWVRDIPLGLKLLLRKYVKAVCHACQNRILSIRRDVITLLLMSLASVVDTAFGRNPTLAEGGLKYLQSAKRIVSAQKNHL